MTDGVVVGLVVAGIIVGTGSLLRWLCERADDGLDVWGDDQ